MYTFVTLYIKKHHFYFSSLENLQIGDFVLESAQQVYFTKNHQSPDKYQKANGTTFCCNVSAIEDGQEHCKQLYTVFVWPQFIAITIGIC